MPGRPLSRRTFLKALAAAALTPAVARAFGEGARFVPAVAQFGAHWDARVSGVRRLAWELQRRTSVEVLPEARPFPLSSEALFEYPFLYLGGQGALPALSAAESDVLGRYLTFGGFLLIDANAGAVDTDFDRSVRAMLARLLPRSPLTPVPQEHVIYKTFFLLDSPPGRLFDKPQLQMANLGKRAAVVYTQNDLLGAFQRDEAGNFELEVTPGGEQQRELAFRLAINLCMYALCLDYKDDAVHLPLILQKRR
jgi:hypothetical protein